MGGFDLTLYLLLHIPAFVMLIVGLFIRKQNPVAAKVLFILTGIYFLIGGGICGLLVG